MSTNVKLSKAHLAKIIQLGRFLANLIGNLIKKALTDLTVPFANDVLPKLATEATSSFIEKFERKISGQGALIAEKGLTLFILNEDMDDVIKIENLQKIQVC